MLPLLAKAALLATSIHPQAAHLAATEVTVASGDTLSGIAVAQCAKANDWTGIYARNRSVIGANPNLILPGQRLTMECTDPPALLKLGQTSAAPVRRVLTPAPGLAYGKPNFCGDGDGDGWDVACPKAAPAQAAAPVQAAPVQQAATYSGGSGFQACVIARESGGNSQVMNSTGHYGLYQFSASTWAAYGGNPASLGNASVAQQNQVFANAMATPGGASNWSPYDGC